MFPPLQVVDKWNNMYRAAFSGLIFNSTQTSPTTFSQDSSSDTSWSSDSDNGNGIKAYTPLKYDSTGTTQATMITYNCASGCNPATSTIGNAGTPFYRAASSNIDQSACFNKPACVQHSGWCTWTDARRRRTDNRRRRYRREAMTPTTRPVPQRRDTDDSVCHYRKFVSGVCQQLDQQNNVWSAPTSGAQGCYYDGSSWSSYTYGEAYANPKFYLRSTQDPYIAAQRITGGSMDFGLTQAQEATIGGSLLGVGLCFMLPMCCFFFWLYRRNQNNQSNGITMQGVSNMGPGPQAPPPVTSAVVGHANDYTYPQPPPPMPPPPAGNYGQPPLPPGWQETVDPNSGKTYYYNSTTNETVWDRPTHVPTY